MEFDMIRIKSLLRTGLLKLKTLIDNKKMFRRFVIKSVLVVSAFVLIVVLFTNRSNSADSLPVNANSNDDSRTASIIDDFLETKPWNENDYSNAYKELPDNALEDTTSPSISSKLVVIDPGHGGIDPGTISEEHNIYEKDIVLDVGLKLRKILEKSGVSVHMTRTDDVFMKPSEKIEVANEKEASLFVSLHVNYFDNKSARGLSTYYMPTEYASCGSLTGKDYATAVQDELIKIQGVKDRKIVPDKKLIVLNHAKMPAVLVELGFISNDEDIKLLMSDDVKTSYAEAIAEGIIKSLEFVD